MIYTLMFGAPVRGGDHELGTLHRIIVNNGVANQITVNPSGLFGGPERVVPINDIAEARAEGLTLNADDVEWKAYSAYEIQRYIAADTASAPSMLPASTPTEITSEALSVPTAGAADMARATTAMSVSLTSSTHVGDLGRLAGMIVDTGIPQDLVLEHGDRVPFTEVGVVDEKQITLGPVAGRLDGVTARDGLADAPPRLDGVTPPRTIGQERRHDK